jgi:hypothetical protein
MKSLLTSLFLFSLITCQAMAGQADLEKTCLQDVDDEFKSSISVKLVINPETGTTTSIKSLTIFTEDKFCLDSLNRDDVSYDLPASPNDIYTNLKCFKNLKADNHFYLVNEWVNYNTGLIVHLEYMNEFDSEDACRSNL